MRLRVVPYVLSSTNCWVCLTFTLCISVKPRIFCEMFKIMKFCAIVLCTCTGTWTSCTCTCTGTWTSCTGTCTCTSCTCTCTWWHSTCYKTGVRTTIRLSISIFHLDLTPFDCDFHVEWQSTGTGRRTLLVSIASPVAWICRKIWGSGLVRSRYQTVSDYALRQWYPNTQQSRFLTACRRVEKLVLPSTFDTSFVPDAVKLAELSNNSFEWKNVTF